MSNIGIHGTQTTQTNADILIINKKICVCLRILRHPRPVMSIRHILQCVKPMSPVMITGQMQADKLHPLSNMHGVLYALASICE